ncbi:NFATC2-interacting protein [Gastrophryne carolinensis]
MALYNVSQYERPITTAYMLRMCQAREQLGCDQEVRPITPVKAEAIVDVEDVEGAVCQVAKNGGQESVQESPDTEMKAEAGERSTCTAASSSSYHRYDASDSSDSDVAVVIPHRPKRRRILPGTAPIVSTVYSNKVSSSLKLLHDVGSVAEMEKELQDKQGCSGNEAPAEPLPIMSSPPPLVLSDTENVDGEQDEVQRERLRNSSPSPPPTPKTPVSKGRKGRFNRKIRKMEACLQDLGTVLSPIRNSILDDDVIVVATSPTPELTIKVRCKGAIFRINTRMTDPLQRLVESVASRLEVDPSQVVLLQENEELSLKETPKSLNLTVADIIDCMVLSSTEQGSNAGPTEDKICLKVQGKDKESQLSVAVGKDEPLQSLMDQYKAAMGLTHWVCFMFEGQKLKGRNTANQLGLENDDIIEAWT